jgi:hypothetical protein
MAKKQDRKTVEIGRKRIPLRSLMHGKEIREAARAIEDFRMKMNEQEFLYGAKLYIDWVDYNSASVVARRPETDKEYADRLERARVAEEQKREREKKRKAAEELRKAQVAERARKKDLEDLKIIVSRMGITDKELVDILTP